MDELLQRIAQELAGNVSAIVIERVRREIDTAFKGGVEFGWLEAELAEKLGCSAQSIASARKEGLIDYTYNPAGRPFYLKQHVFAYLLRHERRSGMNGKEAAVMTEVKREGRLAMVG